MADAALRWKPAARIAWREMCASRVKFAFVILAVAVGVAALTGVRGFSDAFHQALLENARTLMASDLAARIRHQPTQAELDRLDALTFPSSSGAPLERTRTVEMFSMASSPENPIPLLVALKAVDPSKYPFYGNLGLEGIPAGKSHALPDLLTDSTVLVADGLIGRLHTSVGAPLQIGNSTFRIAGIIRHEPDRLSSVMAFGPRVMISRAALAQTGLMAPGAHATVRFLYKLPPGTDIVRARNRLQHALPNAEVTDYHEVNPSIAAGLRRSTALLSLICLVALVLGAIGAGMAMRTHIEERIEILAILKSIGARSSSILRIYLLQTLFLGMLGGLIGVALGMAVQVFIPVILGRLFTIHAGLRFFIGPAAAGLAVGILTTLLFSLVPLLSVRKVPPALVLRRFLQPERSGTEATPAKGVVSRLYAAVRQDSLRWIIPAVILVGLAAIAAFLSGSALVGRWFAAALCSVLLVAFVVSAIGMRLLRRLLANARWLFHSSIRHGLSNLYRPGNQSAVLLSALAVGVMLVLAVVLTERSIVQVTGQTIAPGVPNVFLIDIAANELSGVAHFLAHSSDRRGPVEKLAVVQGNILSIDGTEASVLRQGRDSKSLLRTVPLASSETVPVGSEVIQGAWWRKDDGESLAITPWVASGLHLHLGSRLAFLVEGRTIHARVVAIVKHDGNHVYGRSGFIFTPAALAGLHPIWYAGVHVETGRIGDFEAAFYRAFPTITIINVADLLTTVQGILKTINSVVRFLAAFSILVGVIVLASSVAGTRLRRIREVAVFKMLGARARHIIAVFSVEFMVLGFAAGLLGVIFANLLARVLLARWEVDYHFDWGITIAAILATMALAVASGWLASFRILAQRPMEALREE